MSKSPLVYPPRALHSSPGSQDLIQRRSLLKGLGSAGSLIALSTSGLAGTAWAHGSLRFKLGVASGDPHAHGFTIWTRLASDPLSPDGGMTRGGQLVRFEVALDPDMRRIIRTGGVWSQARDGHNVKVHLHGLPSDRWYWYRFIVQGEDSPIGRTRTFPWFWEQSQRMRFALASCQDYQNGYFAAYANMAQEELDAVIHVGDYIYEYGPQPQAARQHNAPETVSLEDYRIRYALYRLDPSLQAAHAAFPFICTWDDHEVENNYAKLTPEAGQDPVAFRKRRRAAYQAYWEAMPLAASTYPQRGKMRLFRRTDFGSLASFFVLDSRQFRSDQPCDPDDSAIQPACPERLDHAQSMLGRRQLYWLGRGFRRNRSVWNMLAQQVMFTPWNLQAINPNASEIYNMDAWDGYPRARERVLRLIDRFRPSNPVILTGDIHSAWAANIKRDSADPESRSVATEFVGTSISSDFPAQFIPLVQATLPDNPQIRYFDGSYRGYLRFDLNERECRVDYRALQSVLDPQSEISTAASFVVESGRPEIEAG